MSSGNNRKKSSTFVAVIAVSIVAIWVISGIVIYFSLETWSDRGTFGDMFGAINALFSGLALAGVVYAILQQQEELSLHYKELKRTASAQEKSEKALREQVEIQAQSAKLNAMSTVLSHLNSEIAHSSGLDKERLQKDAQKVLLQIEELMS